MIITKKKILAVIPQDAKHLEIQKRSVNKALQDSKFIAHLEKTQAKTEMIQTFNKGKLPKPQTVIDYYQQEFGFILDNPESALNVK